jgi:hypothetical protein
MSTRNLSLMACALLVSAALSAQTKNSGTVTCKSDPSAPVALTDRPHHAFAVGRAQCTWSGFEVAGLKAKDGISTDLDEIAGDMMTFRGYHVATMSNGEKMIVRYQGKGTSKNGKPVSGAGTWAYVRGTGKLKGIKGKGTFNGTADAAGTTFTYKIDGEYSLSK